MLKIIPTPKGEPQKATVTIQFTVEHTPGSEDHLDAILENYFRPKGVKYKDGVIEV